MTVKRLIAVCAVAGLMMPGFAGAAAKTYQVTGNVVDLKDKVVTVEKSGEKYEIEKNADTIVKGELKVGEKVTAIYRMTTDIAKSAAKSYQVTGPILELTDSLIVVDKSGEKWEIDRAGEPSVTGDLKVGSKVTLKYAMTATKINGKRDGKEEKEPKKDKAEKKKTP
jgi:hypothetical protein